MSNIELKNEIKNTLTQIITPSFLLSAIAQSKVMDVSKFEGAVVDEFSEDHVNHLGDVSSALAEMMLSGNVKTPIKYVQYIALVNTRHGSDLLIGYAPKGQTVTPCDLLDLHCIDSDDDLDVVEFKQKEGVFISEDDLIIPNKTPVASLKEYSSSESILEEFGIKECLIHCQTTNLVTVANFPEDKVSIQIGVFSDGKYLIDSELAKKADYLFEKLSTYYKQDKHNINSVLLEITEELDDSPSTYCVSCEPIDELLDHVIIETESLEMLVEEVENLVCENWQ